MARKRRRNDFQAGELNLTAMIDIAFQMLSFFIITVHPVDVLATLDVFAPSSETQKQDKMAPPAGMIRVTIFVDGYTINDKRVDKPRLDSVLEKLASIDRNQTILIMCTAASSHDKLIDVLDLCEKAKLKNLSVVSMN